MLELRIAGSLKIIVLVRIPRVWAIYRIPHKSIKSKNEFWMKKDKIRHETKCFYWIYIGFPSCQEVIITYMKIETLIILEFRNTTFYNSNAIKWLPPRQDLKGRMCATLSMSVKKRGGFRFTLDSKYHLQHHINYIHKSADVLY